MHQRGRINYVTFAVSLCVAGVAALVFLVLFTANSPTQATNQFLAALAHGNVDELMNMSWYDGDRAKLKQEFEFSTQVAGKYYAFTWTTVKDKRSGDSASVEITITKNFRSPQAYPEQTEIPLVLRNGRWLVDIKAVDRKIYPDLPS